MPGIIVSVVVALLAVLAKASRSSEKPAGAKFTVDRIANIVLLVDGGWFLAEVVRLSAAAWFTLPNLTLDQMSKLGPVATAVAAIVALIVGGITVWQKTNADRRDQWWKRTQWALSLALDHDPDDPRTTAGWAAIDYQLRSRLAKAEETEFLSSFAKRTVRTTVSLVDEAIADSLKPGSDADSDVASIQQTPQPAPDKKGGVGNDS